ncbi:MAG: Fic family protein [Spirochaetales bacterium]|nr:Fic family protein [Spirochaetales bacterium]
MDTKDFMAGIYKKADNYRYFMPEKINRAFIWTDTMLNEILEKASLKLGELNSFSRLVPDTDMFILMYIVKEAVISSRIEGTRTNIEEAFAEESDIDPEKRDDWKEVKNYVNAMNQAINDLEKLPLSNRLIRKTHEILLSGSRGETKTPGEFRKSQNWIGGVSLGDAVFIPPSHIELPELLSDFEKFLHNSDIHVPHLVKIAIAHYQFETIHPFLDGNGRIGRLLITLYLVANGILEKPLLYLSDFFNKNKTLYYDNLTFVRTKNDLNQWIRFFLTGVIDTAENGVATLRKIIALKETIEHDHIMKMGKRLQTGLALLHGILRQPLVSAKDVQEMTRLSPKAANDIIDIFIEKNILVETTGYRRNRSYLFESYIRMF